MSYIFYKILPKELIQTLEVLLQEIKALDNIKAVRLISSAYDNFHSINFELQVVLNRAPEVDEVYDKAETLVFQADSDLRDLTNERWYFEVECVSTFERYKVWPDWIVIYQD